MFGLGWRKVRRKVAQPHHLGLRPSAQGQAKGPPTPGEHLFRLGCWRALAAPASRRSASFACRLSCVQRHVEDPPVGCLLLEAGVRGGPVGSKVHTPPGAHTFGRAPSGQAVRIALLLWCEGPGWGGLGAVRGAGLAEGGSGLGAGPRFWHEEDSQQRLAVS